MLLDLKNCKAFCIVVQLMMLSNSLDSNGSLVTIKYSQENGINFRLNSNGNKLVM